MRLTAYKIVGKVQSSAVRADLRCEHFGYRSNPRTAAFDKVKAIEYLLDRPECDEFTDFALGHEYSQEPSGASVRRSSHISDEKAESYLRQRALRKSYESRLELLNSEGKNNDIEINEDSVADFWRFIEFAFPKTKASIMLSSQGTVRAVWRTGPENHVGLHFKGDGVVHYVIFKLVPTDEKITRVVGVCKYVDALSLVERYGLTSLV